MTRQEVEKMIPLLRHIMTSLRDAWNGLIQARTAQEMLQKKETLTFEQKVELELLEEQLKQYNQRIGSYNREVEALGGVVLQYGIQKVAFQVDGRYFCTWSIQEGIRLEHPSQVFAQV